MRYALFLRFPSVFASGRGSTNGLDFRVPGRDSPVSLQRQLQDYLVPGGAYYDSEKCFSQTAPGGAWDYSNIGFGLLGYLASRIAGEDLREKTRREIFLPLGMKHTTWRIADTPVALRG